MKYSYTWNHISLFAKLCNSIDDDDSVTSTWISIVEDHHSTTFPFTLWPLTYRTSDVTTSPSICSPMLMSFTDSVTGFKINVKIYITNEVIIICIQDKHISNSPSTSCEHPSINIRGDELKDHSFYHTIPNIRSCISLPCNVNRAYNLIKSDVLRRIYNCISESQNEYTESIRCVICIGHGLSSSLASCLASDIGKEYETQKQFLGLDDRSVCIDYIGFSYPPMASMLYWDSNHGYIDNYISIGNTSLKPYRIGTLINNPFVSYINVTEKNKNKMSISSIRSKISSDKRHEEMKICEYISHIDKKITLDI